MPFGASPGGIHMAAGPDRMHLMYEGLGTALITWITAILVAAGTISNVTLNVALNVTFNALGSCRGDERN